MDENFVEFDANKCLILYNIWWRGAEAANQEGRASLGWVGEVQSIHVEEKIDEVSGQFRGAGWSLRRREVSVKMGLAITSGWCFIWKKKKIKSLIKVQIECDQKHWARIKVGYTMELILVGFEANWDFCLILNICLKLDKNDDKSSKYNQCLVVGYSSTF